MEWQEGGGWFFTNTLTRVLFLDWPGGAGIDDVIWICFPGAKGQEGTEFYDAASCQCSNARLQCVRKTAVPNVLVRGLTDRG